MIKKESRESVRVKKHKRIRNRISGTTMRPRLAVYRSNMHIYAQVIDDTLGRTLCAASTLEAQVKSELEHTNDVAAATYVGTLIGKRASELGITKVVYDRGGFIYQGKVAALAEAARAAGLEF
ncbi:MAG: 50S ribosomal protein L18 [Lachnospiraceae bacterium]|jgi:large subunit ribosomal protein L18|nr:50S ribosomal protein L18 [Lachnospiraceae bacterium]